MNEAVDFVLSGRVQGVGFRPFVYRLAHEMGVKGWVRNAVGRVEIHAEGNQENLAGFRQALIKLAPPLAQPEIETERPSENQDAEGFYILRSEAQAQAAIHIPPDQYLCRDCESEFNEPGNRRYQYPFINCTQCGPRYTIIRDMPYDRENTSMALFKQCDACDAEYQAEHSRRFHAEPNACGECGPHCSYFDAENLIEGDSGAAISSAVKAVKHGRIIAMKGVGGYHLICDAGNEVAVSRLRKNKHRPHKPLAVMVPESGKDGLDVVRTLVLLDDQSVDELTSQQRPIVLLPRRSNTLVCDEVAPGLDDLGVMLPPSPMHAVFLKALGKPIVATSGNISGEPVITDDTEARDRLSHVAEAWLTHNRDIVRPADDTVKRYLYDKPRTIRLGRGSAPLEKKLGTSLDYPVLAVGGHMKNTIALAWGNRIVVSPHIGDLSAYRSQNIFEQVIHDLQSLYQVEAEAIVCDMHTQYVSSRWATRQGKPVTPVQHHRAHASALVGEHQYEGAGLVFTWDGIGMGDDGSLWGGETFIGTPGDWQRVASFRPFRLLGGDRVSREPWRSAAALHWELGQPYIGSDAAKLAHAAWLNGLNVVRTSSAGRLFDAAAALLGLVHEASYEGQGPMQLEAIAKPENTKASLPLSRDQDDEKLMRVNWQPLIEMLSDKTQSVEQRAGTFHIMLANTIVELARVLKDEYYFESVGMTGGVFQNRLLTELTVERLDDAGFCSHIHQDVPANDGGLSFGQIIEYQAMQCRNNS